MPEINEAARISLPGLGSKAPDFVAMTTFGPIQLSDYQGKWVLLFSHPGDFTPVCTTEFLAFTQLYQDFEERGVQLFGLSIDSNASHLGWVENIYRNTGVEIPFPIIDDREMRVAKLYGMISPLITTASTVRAVFFIDPNQIIRLILYYPSGIGRNIYEILRCVDALQTLDAHNVLMPANWMPGSPVIVPPPNTYQGLKEREASEAEEGYCCMDWYLCFKQLEQEPK